MLPRLLCCALILGTILWRVPSASAAHGPIIVVPPGWPKVVSIPRLKDVSPVENTPLLKPADYEMPKGWFDVAWYDRGVRPGDIGHAAILGHLDSYTGPAAFYHLRDLRRGDRVSVRYRNGRWLTFRVVWQATYLNGGLPMGWIFGPSSQRGLILMTCTGLFHRDGTGYDHKLIVYARLVLPNGRLG